MNFNEKVFELKMKYTEIILIKKNINHAAVTPGSNEQN